MEKMETYIDVAIHALNKKGEELCGDQADLFKSEDEVFFVMADGLGSGVKANILATLTVKIAMTMLRHGESLEETIDTIMQTLPVCSVRKVAYSTFCMVHLKNDGRCRLIEYHNPPVFFCRNGRITPYVSTYETYGDKEVRISELELGIGDYLTIVSDGAVHAGVGTMLNHGWEWPHIAAFLNRQQPKSAELISKTLIETCNNLYGGLPGDDTSVATLMLVEPKVTRLFSGPPVQREQDHEVAARFVQGSVKRVVCGGTAANLMARELNRELRCEMDYYEPSIPPIAHIKGIDLVTEGVLTLKRVSEKLEDYADGHIIPFGKPDAATLILDLLINDSTHIEFWIGKAINPAHQNPDFPFELSIKQNILDRIIATLRKIGKIVTIQYV